MGSLAKKPLPPPFDGARTGRPIVVSHRAGGNEAPENTLAALRNAQKAGSKLMQMDILQIADGTPVITHDTDLQRTHGVDIGVKRIPCIEALPPFKEVLEPMLPIGGAKPLNTGSFEDGRRIPLLKELLEETNADTFLLLEIWEDDQALTDRVAKTIKDAGFEKRVILGNPFSTSQWNFCRKALPGVSTILPLSEVYRLYAFYLLGLVSFWRPPCSSPIVLNIPLLTTNWHLGMAGQAGKTWKQKLRRFLILRQCAFWRWLLPRSKLFYWLQERGIPVMVYLLNRPMDWEYALSLDGVSAIMTDNPTALRKYLSGRDSKKTL